MLQNFVRNLAVQSFGLIAKLGLHRVPVFDRIFLGLYEIYKHYFEAGPVDRLREFAPSGSLVIDVGANVGFFSLRFARWVGDSGRVIAIEPEDRNYNNLMLALEREGVSGRVHAMKAVAAESPGAAFLEINPIQPADHKLSRDGKGLAVQAVTLDDIAQHNQDLKLALVKIDVQGAEMLVLKGATGILKNAAPALFIELHEEGLNKFGTSVSAILDYLSEYGYEAYWLVRSGEHAKTAPAEIHARVARNGYVDVLFLRTVRLP